MSMYERMSRKERRAVQFGTAEQRQVVRKKYEPRAPFYVKETDGRILVPAIPMHESVMPYMLSYRDIPDEYKQRSYSNKQAGTATTAAEFEHMLSRWFFKGLQYMDMQVKSNVVQENESQTPEQALKQYIGTILRDMEPSHEHKFAYLTYVCAQCCVEIKWMEK